MLEFLFHSFTFLLFRTIGSMVLTDAVPTKTMLLLMLLAVAVLPATPRVLPAWTRRAPAYGIGGLAAFWTIERVAGFWR